MVQVQAGVSKHTLATPLQTIGKNGHLNLYVSNESPQDVFFDDITVKHTTGPLQQEQSFYPYGLQMSSINNKAILKSTDPQAQDEKLSGAGIRRKFCVWVSSAGRL